MCLTTSRSIRHLKRGKDSILFSLFLFFLCLSHTSKPNWTKTCEKTKNEIEGREQWKKIQELSQSSHSSLPTRLPPPGLCAFIFPNARKLVLPLLFSLYYSFPNMLTLAIGPCRCSICVKSSCSQRSDHSVKLGYCLVPICYIQDFHCCVFEWERLSSNLSLWSRICSPIFVMLVTFVNTV